MQITKLEPNAYMLVFANDAEETHILQLLSGAQKQSLKACEVMRILDISRPTLCHYVKRGQLKTVKDYSGKQYRYDAESVYALLDHKQASGGK